MIHFHTSCLHLCAGEGRSGSGPESRTGGHTVGPFGPQSDWPQWIAVTLHRTASVPPVASSYDIVQFADGPLQNLLSVFWVWFVPWWRAGHERPLTASLRSMLQVGCVFMWKKWYWEKKKTLLPQSLHWLLWMSEGVEMAHLAQSCHWIPCPCCLDMFTGGEQPSTDNRSEASHRRAAAQRDLLIVSSNSLYFQRSKGLWPRPVHTLKANQHRLALVTAILIIIDRRNQYMLITLIGSPSSLNIKNWNVLNFWHHVNSAAFNFVPVKVVIFFLFKCK